MSDVQTIRLPYQWKPRSYQQKLWDYLEHGGKRAVAVWHRRAGKDEVCLHHTACAMQERVGNYAHMLPEYAQARKAIWDAVNPHSGIRRIDEAFPVDIRSFTREQEMMIGFPNGSTWQVVGSDNYNSLMGTAYAGMVLSEYALANPSAWGYFSPILMENNGWALFISTPRGKNHFHDMVKMAQKQKDWYFESLTNDDTHVFTDDSLALERQRLIDLHGDDYGLALFLQEYFCSFDAQIMGSIFGDCVTRAEREGRVVDFEHDRLAPVYTAWDLGRTDDTSIWFYQFNGGSIDLIDHYAAHGKEIDEYVEVLREKAETHAYHYTTHYLPHDARPRRLGMGGKSILQQFQDAAAHHKDLGRFAFVPKLDTQEGIQAARKTFPKCRFHKIKCEKGLNSLRHYHRTWDDDLKKFLDVAVHDWSSHDCDAFRYLSLSWKHPKPSEGPPLTLQDRLIKHSIQHETMGNIRKRLFLHKRNQREAMMN